MLNCILIDDEQHAIDLLEIHFKKIDYVNVIKTFNNPLHALSFLEDNTVDLIFLDIEMPEISGIEFIKLLKKKTDIIITSAFKQYAIEGFENEVLDYLLKPVALDRLLHSLQRAKAKKTEKLAYNTEEFIVLKTDSKNKLLKVDLSDIIYVEGLKNYIAVFTEQQKIVTLLNMKSIEESLPNDKFIRTHKSYIVSINKVKSVDGSQIFLKGTDEIIPISDSYKTMFFEILRKNLIENK